MADKPSHVFDREREWRALDSFAADQRDQATLGVVSDAKLTCYGGAGFDSELTAANDVVLVPLDRLYAD